jgi:hypothetical protein
MLRNRANAQFGKNLSYGKRMRNVRLTRFPLLFAVGLFGYNECALNDREVCLWVVKFRNPQNFTEFCSIWTGFRKQARQAIAQDRNTTRWCWIAHFWPFSLRTAYNPSI